MNKTSNANHLSAKCRTEGHFPGIMAETALLQTFMDKAQAGQIVEVGDILRAYEEKLGRHRKRGRRKLHAYRGRQRPAGSGGYSANIRRSSAELFRFGYVLI
jgi:hypothetical protein